MSTDTSTTISMDKIVDLVVAAGFPAYVEHTGGGVATLYASHVATDHDPARPVPVLTDAAGDQRYTVVAGPGWFDTTRTGAQETRFAADGDLEDFYVGADDDGEATAYRATTTDTEATLADRIIEALRAAQEAK